MSGVEGIRPGAVTPAAVSSPKANQASGFRDVLTARITFSRHATARMQERAIHLSPTELAQLQEAMGRAGATGAKQAAVVMDSGVFIVAPDSATVITAVHQHGREPMQGISQVDAVVLVGRTSSEEASSPRPTDGGQPAVHWSLVEPSDN